METFSSNKDVVSKINSMINKEYAFLEQRKFTTLTVGMNYIIKNINFLNTRFGKAIVATLYDQDDVNSVIFKTFLPKRVAETVTENFIELINNQDGKFTLTYLGQSPRADGFVDNSQALLNFGCLE
jgi:hypothetical protein